MTRLSFAAIVGALVAIYGYLALLIGGHYSAALKSALSLKIAGQAIPYFGRLLWSGVAGLVVAFLLWLVLKKPRKLLLLDIVLIALMAFALLLSALYA